MNSLNSTEEIVMILLLIVQVHWTSHSHIKNFLTDLKQNYFHNKGRERLALFQPISTLSNLTNATKRSSQEKFIDVQSYVYHCKGSKNG